MMVKATLNYRHKSMDQAKIKGDVIVFPQQLDEKFEGLVQSKTKSWIDKTMESTSWIESTFKVTLLGPKDERDNLWKWIIDKNFILVRSAVMFNHGKFRQFLDHEVLDNTSEPVFKFDESRLPELAKTLRELLVTMEHKAKESAIIDDLSCTVEKITQDEADDVAAVRDRDQGGGLGYVAVLESAEESSTRQKYFETIRSTTSGEEKEAVIRRGDNPVNEFIENGANIMRLFRGHFPLMKLDYKGETTETCTGSKQKKANHKGATSRPLQAKGTLTVNEMKHMLLQGSAEIAKELPLLFYLANQVQRHTVLRSTVVRVLHGKEMLFHELAHDSGFEKRLTEAVQNPDTPDAEKLFRQCIQIFTSVGQSKPWSAYERQAVMPRMYALADRHSQPSIFYTIAVDDTRSVYTVRLSFPSRSNEHFPGFATENARSYWQKNAGDVHSSVQGEMRAMLDALTGEGCINIELNGKTDPFTKMQYQRLVVENPVAATQVFELLTQTAKRILFRVDSDAKKTHPKFDCRPPDTFPKAHAPNGLPGIFSVVTADIDVVEQNQRGSMHIHGLKWTSLSPALLANIAGNEKLWDIASAAIETQFKAEVSAATHTLYRLHKAAGVLPARASFTSGANIPPSLETRTLPQISQDDSISALVLNGHFNHSFTCHKNKSGQTGCRSGYQAGHPVPRTTILELVCSKQPIPLERLTADDGAPFRCSGLSAGCQRPWTGLLEPPPRTVKATPAKRVDPTTKAAEKGTTAAAAAAAAATATTAAVAAPLVQEPTRIFLVKPSPKLTHPERLKMDIADSDGGGKHTQHGGDDVGSDDDGSDDDDDDDDDDDPTVGLKRKKHAVKDIINYYIINSLNFVLFCPTRFFTRTFSNGSISRPGI